MFHFCCCQEENQNDSEAGEVLENAAGDLEVGEMEER